MKNIPYWRRSVECVWHPYSKIDEMESEPFPVMERGEGIYLFDTDGNRYIDGISSWWAMNLGHGHPRIVNAIKRQAGTLQHSMIGGMSHSAVIELAERLISICPAGLRKVFFASDGSSAVEAAIKIAVQYWHNTGKRNKTKFVSIEGGYHGDTLGAVSVGMVPSFHKAYRPLLFDAYKAESPYCYRCPRGKAPDSCNTDCISSMEAILAERAERLAAVVVEPLNQAATGMRIYPANYLSRLSALCKRHDVLLIADEVAMGFGRSGRMFASDYASPPDILCLGKGMSAGYLPISATVVTDQIHSSFRNDGDVDRTFYHGHTFTGNPIAAATALETLKVFDEEQVLLHMQPAADALADGLKWLSSMPYVDGVRQIGMVGALEIVIDKESRTPFSPKLRMGQRICKEALRRGALLRPLGDVLYLWPPLNMPPDQMRKLTEILAESIACVLPAANGSTAT